MVFNSSHTKSNAHTVGQLQWTTETHQAASQDLKASWLSTSCGEREHPALRTMHQLSFLRHGLRAAKRTPLTLGPRTNINGLSRFKSGAASPKAPQAMSKRQPQGPSQTARGMKDRQPRTSQQHQKQPAVPRRRRLNRATGEVEEQRSDGTFASISARPRQRQRPPRRRAPKSSPSASPNRLGHNFPSVAAFKPDRSVAHKRSPRETGSASESAKATKEAGDLEQLDAVEVSAAGEGELLDDDEFGEMENLEKEAETYHRLNRATGKIELVDNQGEITEVVQSLETLFAEPEEEEATRVSNTRLPKRYVVISIYANPNKPRDRSKKRLERAKLEQEDEEEEMPRPKPKPKKRSIVKVQRGPVILPPSLTVRELSLSSGINAYDLIKKVAELGALDMDQTAGESGSLTRVKGKLDPYLLAQFRVEAEGGRRRIASKQVSTVAQSLLLSAEISELLMMEFGLESELQIDKVVDEARTVMEDAEGMDARPPMVTVMGHVDHGKTTLMDTLRNASVAAGEEGGITQKVAAFSFGLGDGNLPATFVDTPGHEAFASMRRCGALVTDIIVLIIAATDGVRPQTVECIELAKAGNVPLIIALTKVDVDGIDEEEAKMRVSNELAAYGVNTEVVGGDVQIVPIAAPKGIGLEALVEAITLQAEVMELRADKKARGEAVVLESFLDPSLGPIADVIVRWGTLSAGDIVVVGEEHGKIRKLLSTVDGAELKAATPAMPARVLGLSSCVRPGLDLLVVPDNKRAKQVVSLRTRRRVGAEAIAESDRENLAGEEAEGDEDDQDGEDSALPLKQDPIFCKLVLKADTDGGLEALKYSVEALNLKVTEQISTELAQEQELTLPEGSGFVVVRKGIGPISKQDLEIASSFGAAVYGFNVRAPRNIVAAASAEGIEVVNKGVIYHILEDIESSLYKSAAPSTVEKVVGKAEVLQTFVMNPERRGDSEWTVAGCKIADGEISVSNRVRVTRQGEVIHSSSGIDSLRHYKRKVKSLAKGQECGISLSGFQDFQNGDIIEFYVLEAAS